ncbi:hypothetical protein ACA758_04795 [Mycoplasmopsis agassizii]|uniref:hypothetical protein n=1 Tax=Mycoplasmopsis agassizii TaxID=33922 RepID=UPI0035291D1F
MSYRGGFLGIHYTVWPYNDESIWTSAYAGAGSTSRGTYGFGSYFFTYKTILDLEQSLLKNINSSVEIMDLKEIIFNQPDKSHSYFDREKGILYINTKSSWKEDKKLTTEQRIEKTLSIIQKELVDDMLNLFSINLGSSSHPWKGEKIDNKESIYIAYNNYSHYYEDSISRPLSYDKFDKKFVESFLEILNLHFNELNNSYKGEELAVPYNSFIGKEFSASELFLIANGDPRTKEVKDLVKRFGYNEYLIEENGSFYTYDIKDVRREFSLKKLLSKYFVKIFSTQNKNEQNENVPKLIMANSLYGGTLKTANGDVTLENKVKDLYALLLDKLKLDNEISYMTIKNNVIKNSGEYESTKVISYDLDYVGFGGYLSLEKAKIYKGLVIKKDDKYELARLKLINFKNDYSENDFPFKAKKSLETEDYWNPSNAINSDLLVAWFAEAYVHLANSNDVTLYFWDDTNMDQLLQDDELVNIVNKSDKLIATDKRYSPDISKYKNYSLKTVDSKVKVILNKTDVEFE